MRTKVEVYLNNKSLDALDSRLILQKVDEAKPSLKVATVPLAGGIGSIITGTKREYLEVNVEFAIAEKSDLAARAEILSRVNGWAAGGGELKVNYRRGMMLDVVCTELPQVGYIKEWTGNYKIQFRAYGVPYWQSAIHDHYDFSDGERRDIYIKGTAETALEFVQTMTAPQDIKAETGLPYTTKSFIDVYDANGERISHYGIRWHEATGEGWKLEGRMQGPLMMVEFVDPDGVRHNAMEYVDNNNTDNLTIGSGIQTVEFYSEEIDGAKRIYLSCEIMVRGRWH